jgi:hypothetical protein
MGAGRILQCRSLVTELLVLNIELVLVIAEVFIESPGSCEQPVSLQAGPEKNAEKPWQAESEANGVHV